MVNYVQQLFPINAFTHSQISKTAMEIMGLDELLNDII